MAQTIKKVDLSLLPDQPRNPLGRQPARQPVVDLSLLPDQPLNPLGRAAIPLPVIQGGPFSGLIPDAGIGDPRPTPGIPLMAKKKTLPAGIPLQQPTITPETIRLLGSHPGSTGKIFPGPEVKEPAGIPLGIPSGNIDKPTGIPPANNDPSIWDSGKVGYDINVVSTHTGRTGWAGVLGNITREEVMDFAAADDAKIAELRKANPEVEWDWSDPGSMAHGMARATGGMIPYMGSGIIKGAKRGVATGLGAGTAALIAGQLGPQIAAPEEVFTVPAATSGGYAVGSVSAMIQNAMEIEGGRIYVDLVRKDIPDEIAKPAAIGAGLVIGIIEQAQIGRIMKHLPGGKYFTKKAITKTIIDNPGLRKKLVKIGLNFGKDMSYEVGEEILQEFTSIGTEAVSHVANMVINGAEYAGTTAGEAVERVKDTAIEMLKALPALLLPGVAKQTGGAIIQTIGEESDLIKKEKIIEALQELANKDELNPGRAAGRKMEEGLGKLQREEEGGTLNQPLETSNAFQTPRREEISDDVEGRQVGRPGEDVRTRGMGNSPAALGRRLETACRNAEEGFSAAGPSVDVVPGDISIRKNLNREERSLVKFGKRVFGRDIAFVDVRPPGLDNHFDGMFEDKTGTVLINHTSASPFITVLGHEMLGHGLLEAHPDLYNELLETVKKEGTGFSEWKARYDKQRGAESKADDAWEEFLSQSAGEIFTSKMFWTKLAQNDPGVFRRLVDWFRAIAKRVQSKLPGPYSVKKYHDDIVGVLSTLVDVTGDYIKREKGIESTRKVIDPNWFDEVRAEAMAIKNANWENEQARINEERGDTYDEQAEEFERHLHEDYAGGDTLTEFLMKGPKIHMNTPGATKSGWKKDSMWGEMDRMKKNMGWGKRALFINNKRADTQSLEDALIAAMEEGYVEPGTDLAEFVSMLDDEVQGGEKHYPIYSNLSLRADQGELPLGIPSEDVGAAIDRRAAELENAGLEPRQGRKRAINEVGSKQRARHRAAPGGRAQQGALDFGTDDLPLFGKSADKPAGIPLMQRKKISPPFGSKHKLAEKSISQNSRNKLNDLHGAAVRKKGLQVAYEQEVKKYFKDLRRAVSDPELVQGNEQGVKELIGRGINTILDRAEAEYYRGNTGKATEFAERALYYIHERATIQHGPEYLNQLSEGQGLLLQRRQETPVSARKRKPVDYPKSLHEAITMAPEIEFKGMPGTEQRKLYDLGKYKEDEEASYRAIIHLIKKEKINGIKRVLSPTDRVVIVPVDKGEGVGVNAHSRVYARILAEMLGGEVLQDIVKVSEGSNTKASGKKRMLNLIKYAGKIKDPGAVHIIADDYFTSGSTTVAQLEHLLDQGADVRIITTVAEGQWGNRLKPEAGMLEKLHKHTELTKEEIKEIVNTDEDYFLNNEIKRLLESGKEKLRRVYSPGKNKRDGSENRELHGPRGTRGHEETGPSLSLRQTISEEDLDRPGEELTVPDVIKKGHRLKRRLTLWLLRTFEPAKLTEWRIGKGATARILRLPGESERDMLKFGLEELETLTGLTFQQLKQYFDQFPKAEQLAVTLSRGDTSLDPVARAIQVKAKAMLPKDSRISSIQEISDWIYGKFQEMIGGKPGYVNDYFYGVYKKPQDVTQFLRYWRTTDAFLKKKAFPTAADAAAYGLELRDSNPIVNLQREFLGVARLAAMMRLKEDLLKTGLAYGRKQDNLFEGAAPASWEGGIVNDPVFADVVVQKDAAMLINNLIQTNAVSASKFGRALRGINKLAQWTKFAGSLFHGMVIMKQALVDSGLGFSDIFRSPKMMGKRVFGGLTEKSSVDMSREELYQEVYIPNGGGHHFSIESQAQQALNDFFEDRNMKGLLKVVRGGVGVVAFLPRKFTNTMFETWIPHVKYEAFKLEYMKLEQKQGSKPTDAQVQEIIKEAQNFYGEMNERLFGRKGTVISLLRFFFMAPSFGEGNFRTMAKAAVQWKGGLGARSRRNIVQSLIATGIVSVIASRLITGEWPEPPEDLDDLRDLFKIDTGLVNDRGEKIMIDMLTYDKDYWDQIVLPIMQAVSGKGPESIGQFFGNFVRRIGHMKTSTAGVAKDLASMLMGEAIVDWKGNDVYYFTDPFLKKVWKTTLHELKRFEPISTSVFRRSTGMGIPPAMALVSSLVGARPAYTERVKNTNRLAREVGSYYKQQQDLYYRLGFQNHPREAITDFNDMVRAAMKSEYTTPDLSERLMKLLIDPKHLLQSKVYNQLTARSADAKKIERSIRYLKNFDVTLPQARRLLKDYCKAPVIRKGVTKGWKHRYTAETWKKHDRVLVDRWNRYYRQATKGTLRSL